MSIVRAFTTRRKPDTELGSSIALGRAASQRNGRPVQRSQISSPVALVSTTNMLSYNAPDIAGTTPIESTGSSSGSSTEDSDGSSNSVHSRETVTDLSSAETSPTSPEPELNHLSCYFKPAVALDAVTPSRSPSTKGRPSMDAPNLPRRAPSHSKKAHEALSRKRSIQRAKSPPSQGRDITRSSTDMFNPANTTFVEAPREHPFGKELAQLDEVAEEFGSTVRNVEADADAAHMRHRGLALYGASDYMNEIHSLIDILLHEDRSPIASDFSGWF